MWSSKGSDRFKIEVESVVYIYIIFGDKVYSRLFC